MVSQEIWLLQLKDKVTKRQLNGPFKKLDEAAPALQEGSAIQATPYSRHQHYCNLHSDPISSLLPLFLE